MNAIEGLQEAVQEEFHERSVLVVGIFRWLALAALIGALVGAVSALFLRALEGSVHFTSMHPLYYMALPFALVLNVLFLHYVFPQDPPPSTDIVIKHIHAGERLRITSILKAFVAPILTIASGGSAGKEAPAADMGAAIGDTVGGLFKLNRAEQRKLAICGISAGFSAIFGTPVAGAIFGLEILFVGSIMYEIILPAFVAGIVAFSVASAMGAPYWYHQITVIPDLNGSTFLMVAIAGVFFGFCAFLLIQAMRAASLTRRFSIWQKVGLALAGGILLIFLTNFFGTQYLGLGIETLERGIEGVPAGPFDWLLKTVFTSLTFAFGGSGGLVTPILFVGSAAGSAFAQVFGLDLATFAAIGAVAVLAGATNAPIAASVLSLELFGPTIGPLAAIACIISFYITGKYSIYPSQRQAVRKFDTLELHSPYLDKVEKPIVTGVKQIHREGKKLHREGRRLQRAGTRHVKKHLRNINNVIRK
jgi:H+/Cl- antiporter ClcA